MAGIKVNELSKARGYWFEYRMRVIPILLARGADSSGEYTFIKGLGLQPFKKEKIFVLRGFDASQSSVQ